MGAGEDGDGVELDRAEVAEDTADARAAGGGGASGSEEALGSQG